MNGSDPGFTKPGFYQIDSFLDRSPSSLEISILLLAKVLFTTLVTTKFYYTLNSMDASFCH